MIVLLKKTICLLLHKLFFKSAKGVTKEVDVLQMTGNLR